MDQQQSDHPMRSLLDKTYATSTSTQNIAILSPFVQLSFVFHLAIAQLQRHIQETPDCVVTVIGSSSQAAFQNTLADEHDAVLFTDSSSDCLTKTLLERIEFRPTPTLSDLTRLLGFLSCTQTRLPSIHHHHHHPLQNPPPIYLVDRVDHNQKWPLSTPTADPEDLRNILEIFRHFFAQIWTIEGLHETDSNTGDDSPTTTPAAVGTSSSPKPGRYRLYSLRSAADSSADDDDQITYQVLEQDALDPQYSAHPERLLRKTVVVPGC
ncbi:RNA polymerase II transcription factor B 52 kDa subunit [Puccinia graminis f. sp. tritici]|uniref:RNA polymerase II transcription factor B 52 kDa subunit n=1 Tax=Puccinia graminis f. sp. tritici TaxID=56615 RepID=A0A5B0RY17_PUCGR|nr:RNA polymerase II transcription factor B 52 kDa subunit [Puccinia graminis f. sp. tritici]